MDGRRTSNNNNNKTTSTILLLLPLIIIIIEDNNNRSTWRSLRFQCIYIEHCNEVRNQDLAATILQFLLCSPTRFYSWDTCRNLQRNQSQWTWTSSQWWLLVWFGSTRQDNSSSLQYGNRRSVTLRVRNRSSQGYVHSVPNSFFVATRKVLRYSMNSNDTELEKFVHTHQTSCSRSC